MSYLLLFYAITVLPNFRLLETYFIAIICTKLMLRENCTMTKSIM